MNDTAELRQLTMLIPPPVKPIGVDGPLNTGTPVLPSDLLSFARSYGSGYFDIDGGIFLEALNPFAPDYSSRWENHMEQIRHYKKSEGDDYVPYDIYPKQPGLVLWGYGEDRKHFFWLTEGPRDNWPVLVMHDLEFFTRFDCSMLSFTRKLLSGELDCAFIGGVDTANNRVDPRTCKFVSILTTR